MNKTDKTGGRVDVFAAAEIRKLVWRAWRRTAKKNNFDAGLFSEDEVEVEHPANPDHGDFSTNIAMIAFGKPDVPDASIDRPLSLAKMMAKELDRFVSAGSLLAAVTVAPPGFINFWLSKAYLLDQAETIASGRYKKKLAAIGGGGTMVIDYSAPNIAKPFGIGHLRSTNIGQAIYNLYTRLGYKTIGDNHLGDWGTQFGKLIYQIKFKMKNEKLEVSALTIKDLEKLYVEFHREAEKKPQMNKDARRWFKKLEEGDKEAKKIWQTCVDVSLKEFARVYKILGVEIDHAYGESFYHFADWMDKVLQDARKKGVLKKSRDAKIVKLPGQKVPAMLVKSDGATTYLLRDLAAIKFRQQTWRPDLIVYEVGADQKLHFRQVFAAARLLGYSGKEGLVHVAHGLIRFKTGKFSTRKGKTISLEEVIKEGIKKAGRLVEATATAKDLSPEKKREIARAVGIGGIKFNDLKQEPERDVIFDWDKVLSLEGYSAPYLQYAYARCRQVLMKSGRGKTTAAGAVLPDKISREEEMLLRLFYRFPEVLVLAAENFSPAVLSQYLFQVGQKFNLFYQKRRIIGSKTEFFRLLLTLTTAGILREGLDLLGIEALERM